MDLSQACSARAQNHTAPERTDRNKRILCCKIKMKKNELLLSVILPIFNEKKRLKNLTTIATYLRSKKFSYEIIVVDDGSNRETKQALDRLQKTLKTTVLHFPTNRGKGYAVKQGMLTAKGKYSLFMDIDLSTPIEIIDVFLRELRSYPIVIATRKSGESKIMKRQPLLRETMGKTFTIISQLITGVTVSDFTCGFKGFSRIAGKKLFSQSLIERWSFDAEILFLAKRYDMRTKEIPVNWKNDKETKVVFPRDILISLIDLVTIRLNNLLGKYD